LIGVGVGDKVKDSARVDDDGEVPVETASRADIAVSSPSAGEETAADALLLVDGYDDELLLEEVELVGPLLDSFVSLRLPARRKRPDRVSDIEDGR